MSDLERDLRSLIDGSPAIDADEVRYRSRRRSRAHSSNRRPVVVAFAALLAVVLVASAIVLLRSGGSDDGSVVVPAQPSPASAPEALVTIAADGRLAVLDRSGNLLRELGSGADLQPGQLSVAPDGSVYFVQQTPTVVAEGQPAGTIVEIPGDGGVQRKVLGDACCNRYPAVSPDGQWLAFSGVPNQSDAGRDILIKARPDDGAAYERRWSGGATLDTGVEILGWSPDSSTVVFVDHDEADPRPRVLDIDTPETASLDDQPLLDLPAGLSFAGYRGDTGQLVLFDRTSAATRVLAWSPPSGDPQLLFTLDGVTSVSVDPSGDHLLAVTDAGLYRWSTGDAAPVLVADANEGIVAAAWLPAIPGSAPTSPTTGAPGATTPANDLSTASPPTTRVGSTPTPTVDGRVVVQVLNGSAVMGAATLRTNDLKAKGWQVLAAGNAPEVRDGAAIQCLDGFASAAAQLRADLRSFGVDAAIEPLPNPLPLAYGTDATCYVILGR